MTTNAKNNPKQVNVGIDVGKAQLDIHIFERNISFSVANDATGIRQALGRLGRYQLARLVLEATGRYERALVDGALGKGLPVVIVNPLHIRRYAGAVGQLAKTDAIDAKLIAQYAAIVQPAVRTHHSKAIIQIKDLLVRRRQLLEMLTMEKNRHHIMPKFLQRDIGRSIRHLQRQLEKVDRELDKRIEAEQEWRAKRELMLSMPGIGPAVVHTLMGDLPELGTLTQNRWPPWRVSPPTTATAANSEANVASVEADIQYAPSCLWPPCRRYSTTR